VALQNPIPPPTGTPSVPDNTKKSRISAAVFIVLFALGAFAQSPDENKPVDRILILKALEQ
jgi:hypothetical protein